MVTPVSSFTVVPITLFSNESIFVSTGGSIVVPFGDAIDNRTPIGSGVFSYFNTVTATVLGEVISENTGTAINFSGVSPGGHTVIVGETGTVSSGINYAAVVLGGAGCVMHNSGQTIGGGGFLGDALSNSRITNDGSIVGMRYYAMQLSNSGTTEIINSGTIIGYSAIVLATSSATIINSGQIRSNAAAKAAIDATTGSAAFTLRNSGEVAGPGTAIIGSAHADQIRNTGTIDGDVFLGVGHDVFKGKLGELVGTLSGDAGSDFLAGGDGDQLIYGGNDNDILNGNAGDDTLFGGSGYDTFVFSRRGDDDTISGFQNGTDKLDLSALHFVNFAALSVAAVNVTGGMLIDFGNQKGGSVFLAGFTEALLDSSDVYL